jgi:hypothetical protein
MRGKEMGTVRLRRASKSRLSSRYGKIAGTGAMSKVDLEIVPMGLFENNNARSHLETLVVQINGTYQAGFYDACAVMCRRLLQCMLLLAFERAKKSEIIRDPCGEYRTFADIILLASSGRHIRLPRGVRAVMGKIEYLGELAACHPAYTTRQKDIDEQRLGFRRLISELAHLAKIKPAGIAAPEEDSPR